MEFNLADIFESVADAVPDREAVVVGENRYTYRQLDQRATRLAHLLHLHGIGPGDHVGLGLYNGVEYVEGMLACFKLRAVPININYRYLNDELAYLLKDSECQVVIHDIDLTDRIEAIQGELPLLRWTIVAGPRYESALEGSSAKRDFGERSGDDLYVLYTGGTTGMPKGVMWRQEDIFFAAMGGRRTTGSKFERPEDVAQAALADPARRSVLPASPLMHGSAQWATFSLFTLGGTVVLSGRRRFDPAAMWQLVADEHIALLLVVGDAFARPLLDALREDPDRWDLGTLRMMMSGGAVLAPAVKNGFAELLPKVKVIDTYGSSEGGTQGQVSTDEGADGRPRFVVGDDTAVIDDQGRPVAPGSGVIGKLARRGHIPLGYFRDAAKTAATFPTLDGIRWSVPGDMATVEPDGSVVLLGRGSVCINTGGEKVFPEEVEAVLKGAPGVFDAVVVGVPDERWGEIVVAIVQTEVGASIDEQQIVDHCRGRLSSYKLPRRLVRVSTVLRSPSGKADYRWAKEQALELVSSATPAAVSAAPRRASSEE